ncbi:hypothetical protein FGB62_14g263 [Gracilaria domingensis]|nr:hypothetical protein FGB62_14g263 [Gracilaria domingensis]
MQYRQHPPQPMHALSGARAKPPAQPPLPNRPLTHTFMPTHAAASAPLAAQRGEQLAASRPPAPTMEPHPTAPLASPRNPLASPRAPFPGPALMSPREVLLTSPRNHLSTSAAMRASFGQERAHVASPPISRPMPPSSLKPEPQPRTTNQSSSIQRDAVNSANNPNNAVDSNVNASKMGLRENHRNGDNSDRTGVNLSNRETPADIKQKFKDNLRFQVPVTCAPPAASRLGPALHARVSPPSKPPPNMQSQPMRIPPWAPPPSSSSLPSSAPIPTSSVVTMAPIHSARTPGARPPAEGFHPLDTPHNNNEYLHDPLATPKGITGLPTAHGHGAAYLPFPSPTTEGLLPPLASSNMPSSAQPPPHLSAGAGPLTPSGQGAAMNPFSSSLGKRPTSERIEAIDASQPQPTVRQRVGGGF